VSAIFLQIAYEGKIGTANPSLSTDAQSLEA
jgi:hypothetical protein